jgi:predicted dehydrogenase
MRRRKFLKQTTLGSVSLFLIGCQTSRRKISANEKLNLGIIGVANRAGENLSGVSSQNIVALCDVDDNYLRAASQKFPAAKTYHDFRRLLERKELDAVVVSTPDHIHAPATMMALRRGLHVYCEKPLTHTISEARLVAETARKHKCVTQMGTQIHAETNYRRVVELVQSGAIGSIEEVHNWVGSLWAGRPLATQQVPIPETFHWDLWLGPAPERPYDPAYIPMHWRGWWDFGGGSMSDMGCHHIDLSFWALGLRYPTSVEAEGPPVNSQTAAPWLIVRYEFPARGALPPVKLTWYNGGKRPHYFAEGKLPKWGDGTLFVGKKGMLLADYSKHVLLPEKDFAGFVPPSPSIPDSLGHHKEWIAACKSGGPTTCNFDYSGALTETVLLGNVSYRAGRRLEWDPKRLRARNCLEASQFIQHHYRQGWAS